LALDYYLVKRYDYCIVAASKQVTRKRKMAFLEAVAPPAKTPAEFKRRVGSISSSDALSAVAWLNKCKGTAAYRRVLQIRGELEQLGAMLDSLRRQRQDGRARRKGSTTFPTQEEITEEVQLAELYTRFREGHNDFNRLLSKYTFVSAMAYDPDTGIWRFNPVPKGRRGRVIEVSDGRFTVEVDETAVVAALARLAANRELYKAHLCEQCHERWRVSERRMDRFCSQQCREAWYTASPEYDKRRQDIQRRYRENVRLKIAAQDAALKGRK
jgi:hypothetical protein